MPMKRVLLLLPTASYRNDDFLAAAKRLEVEVISVANYCHQLAPAWGMSPIQSVPFDQPVAALKQLLVSLGRKPDAVLAVDDSGLDLAALLCEYFHLGGNAPEAVRQTRDKLAFRNLQRRGGLNCPGFLPSGRRRAGRGPAAAARLSRGGQGAPAQCQPRRDPRRHAARLRARRAKGERASRPKPIATPRRSA